MKTTVIGSGLYGQAMAKLLLYNENDVTIWTHEKDIKVVDVPEGAKITNSYEEAIKGAKLIYVLTGSQFSEMVFNSLKPHVTEDMIFILGSKGVLKNKIQIIDLFKEMLPEKKLAVISGPTFAQDIFNLDPIGFTLATKEKDDYQIISNCMKSIHLEYSEDLLGTEICGSLKNAYAIGSGILETFNCGYSTRCLYVTKVLNEMKSIFKQIGADPETVLTLAGVGDLVLTCTSSNSRNFTLGTIISNKKQEEAEKFLATHTVEGYENLKLYHEIFNDKSISAPILETVYNITNFQDDADVLLKVLNS